MSSYYFHRESKNIYILMDDDVCYMWGDRNKTNLALEAQQFFAISEVKAGSGVFIIDADDFENEFVLIDEDNFDEIHEWYGFDELTKQKLKNEIFNVRGKYNGY